MDILLRDLRHAFRLLWREKAFTLTVLVTLGVCIGANAAIFSVINTVLLDPLPYPAADRLVTVFNAYPGAGVPRASNGSYDFFVRRERVDAFEELAQYQGFGHTVGDAGATERVETMRVTASFFPLLGVEPAQGRTFTEEEMTPGQEQVVVLSDAYWRERLGGAPGVVGTDLRVNGQPYRVVGVLPPEFRVPATEQPAFYVPIPYTEEQRTIDVWHSNNFEMLGRLRPGATVDGALAQNEALNAALISEWPIPGAAQILADAGYHTEIHPLHEDLVREIRPTLYLLWGGVAFVLLIGCVNIANLILARSQVRVRDTATRLALGAPRLRLARQVLTHALLLALVGSVLGVVLGLGGIRILGALGASELPRGAEIGMDGTVLLFTLGLAVLAGVIFGAIPSVQLLRQDLRSPLSSESRGGTADRHTLSLRSFLVSAQVALAFLLLIGAGLMLASFREALAVEPGFQPGGVLTARVSMPEVRYPEGGDRVRFVDALVAEMTALPAVERAAATSMLPFSNQGSSSIILPEGYIPPPGESILSPYQSFVTEGYFETMGIPLVAGRTFEAADGLEQRRVIILDQWLAERYYGDESPLGKRMIWGTVPSEATEEDHYLVVGVVGTVKQNDLTADASEHVGAYYIPYTHAAQGSMALVLRTATPPASLTPAVRDRLRGLDPEMPLYSVSTMAERIDESLLSRRASMLLLTGFAGVALFLAVVGIYGVLAYAVAQRSREVGIRMALGSTPPEIFALILSHGARVTGAGLVVGGLSAVLLGRLIRSLLFGVSPLEPAVLLGVAAVLGTVALGACLVPSWQATRVDPVRALVGE